MASNITIIPRTLHVGPYTFHSSGVVLHPLQLAGTIPQPSIETTPQAPAGEGSVQTGVSAILKAFGHG